MQHVLNTKFFTNISFYVTVAAKSDNLNEIQPLPWSQKVSMILLVSFDAALRIESLPM